MDLMNLYISLLKEIWVKGNKKFMIEHVDSLRICLRDNRPDRKVILTDITAPDPRDQKE